MNLIEKIAQLADELGTYVSYEYSLRMDKPGESYGARTETYRVYAKGYNTMYFPTFEQVLALEECDFTKE